MQVRRVVTRRGRHIRGYFPSRKMGRMVAWESLLERDALLLFELSPGVVRYQEQPAEISYWDGSAMRIYIPDFSVELIDEQRVLLEIKPHSELSRPKVAEKYACVAQSLHEQDRRFRILTEQEIRGEPLFSNLQALIYPYTHNLIELDSQLLKDDDLSLVGARSFREWCQKLGRNATLTLIAQGELYVDLTLPLAESSLVTRIQGGRHAAVYF